MIQVVNTHNLNQIYSFLGILMVIFMLLPDVVRGQVSISREGYPYCEPFIGTINDIRRPDVTLFGNGSGPGNLATALTGQSIRLTGNNPFQDGYVYLDLPFSPEYGIQVSFEYLSYGGNGADGIVFYMFDGAYGDLPPSLPFNIGGFGGSLGYAPRISGAVTQPGLSGAYIGVALDEWGNFVSVEGAPATKPNGEGINPNTGDWQYDHSVGIRGPGSGVVGYEVFDYNEVNSSSRPAPDRFTIDTPFPGLTCSDDNYRKVYVNLVPRTDVGYDLTVMMLVGNTPYTIIGPTHYDFDAPETIKLGFSAATGLSTNFHEIRNLAVDVSKVEEAQRPEGTDEFYRTCVDEELEIFIDVDLKSSENAFIQCVQLYDDGLDINNPSASWNTFSSNIDHMQCGLTPICESCTSDLAPIPTSLGTFEATIEDLDDGNFDDLRDRVQVVFTPNPGATGRSKIYYTVTDSYGLTSKPKELVVVINPIPEFLSEPVIELPTCDGQNDGKITAEVGNLIPGFEHFWLYTNTSGVETNLGEGIVIGSVVADGESATFELEGVNVGQYILVIRNPLEDGDDGYCEDQLIIPLIEDELGTPVTVEDDTFLVCEGETVTIVPEVDPIYLNGITPKFLWYKDAAKTQPITSNPGTPAADGFTYEINSSGHLIVDGLLSQSGNPFTYNYYVELDVDRSGSQNICSILGDLEIAATVTVYPAVTFDPPVVQDDWCLGNNGSIEIVFRRGNEVLTQYTLFDEAGNEIRPLQSTGLFEGLSKGKYTVAGTSNNPDCEQLYDFEILGPENTLELNVTTVTDPSCELDNGYVSWQVAGGNGTYEFVSITGYPGPSPPAVNQIGEDVFEVNNLISTPSPYTLTLTVKDAQGCEISSDQILTPQVLPIYEVTSSTVCINETASLTVNILEVGSPDPNTQFKWYSDASATQEIGGANSNPWGITFTVDPVNGTLSASDFPDSDIQQTFDVYFKPTISPASSTTPVVCDLPILPATITVNPLPAIVMVKAQSASCFGGSDGIIEVGVTNGNPADFEYMIDGITGYQSSPVFNSGITEGNYTIRVRTIATQCEDIIDVQLVDPEELILNVTQSIDPSCAIENGQLAFNIVGGTPLPSGGYGITINGSPLSSFNPTESTPNSYLIENLPEGTYTIEAIDANDCPVQSSLSLTAQVLPEYSLQETEICLNESASIIPVVENPGTPDAAPVFRWFKDAGATDEILTGDDVALGLTFSVNNTTGQLDVSNIANAGTYTFYLKPDILNACQLEPIPVTLTVNPIPEADFDPVSPLCFGESNGSLVLASGGSSDYSYSIVGSPTSFDIASNSFQGLAAGDYTIRITNDLTGCFQEINKTIDPTPELLISLISIKDPTCGAINGEISFEVQGGTPDYVLSVNNLPIADFNMVQSGSIYTISQLAPGSYDIKSVDSNDCERTLPSITLENNDGIAVDVTPSDYVICAGGSAELLPDIQAPAGTLFAITWFKDSSFTEEIFNGDQEGALTYSILPDFTLSVTGLSAGQYTYYAKLEGSGVCTIDSESTVEVLAPLEATLTPTSVICFGDANGTLTVENYSGGSGTFEFSVDGTNWQAEPVFENLPTGNYTLSMRDTNGNASCLFTETFTIDSPAGPIQLDRFNTFATSCGEDNGEILDVLISGGWGNYTFKWTKDSPTGTEVTGTINKVDNLSAGDYFLTITDSEGCSEVFEFEVGTAPDPEYTITPPAQVCFGEQVKLEAVHKPGDPNAPSARTTIAWYKNPNQSGLITDGPDPANSDISYTIVEDPNNFVNSTLEIDGLPAGEYTYYLYVECTGVEIPVTFEVFEFPVLTIEGEKESCFQAADGKIIVTGDIEPGMIFQIGSNAYTATELAAATFAPGDYTLEVQGAVCSQSFPVSIEPALEIKAALVDSKNAACGLQDGLLSFEWEGGARPYEISLTPSTGNPISLTTSDLSYTFENLGQGTYTFAILDAEGCLYTMSTPVSVENGPSEIVVDPVYSSCDGNPISITPQVNPSNGDAVFTWYMGSIGSANLISDGQVINGVIFNLNARGNINMQGVTLANAPFKLWVTVDGDGICAGDQKEISIQVFGNPKVQVTPIPELCFGDGGSLELEIPDNQNLEFSLNGGPFVSYPNSIIENLASGIYTLEAQNPSGCIVEVGTFTVAGPAAPLEIQDLTAIGATCLSPNGRLFGTAAGGTGPYNLTVEGPAGAVASSDIVWNGNDFNVENLPLGSYIVTLTDANQCSVTADGLTITNEPLKVIADDLTICEGEDAVLTPRVQGGQGGGLTFSWFKDSEGQDRIPIGSSTDGNITYNLTQNGVLTISGLDLVNSPYRYYAELDLNAACSRDLDEAIVTVKSIPTLRTSNPSLICDPTQTVDLSLYIEGYDPNTYDYEVLDGDDNKMQLDEISTVSQTGVYKVRMKEKNSDCFTATERILVRIAEVELVASFEYNIEVVPGQTVTNSQVGIGDEVMFSDLSQGNPVRWEWDFGDGNTSTEASPNHIYEELGVFIVILRTWDDLGCESTAVMELEIIDNFDIKFPNAFTPDRTDGKNNFFFPKFRGIVFLKVYVFTTWGELIYESNTLEDEGWDGTFRGKPAINGNYVYRGKYRSRGGFEGETSGVFVLIR
ncbi:PKD domain-containing protein [Algoriphagus halophytocola]|uniref:PKD domain-containing protein n=1 Tax=Algoriphagus halophytocola TaxID=2991499 RepID=A0ABY6MHB5_9BACT|nr:PKD domain-containing protein [Algoriphagus sp. TR-M5]UZD23043.1 PKD domain-containing protein [Algoriphagus sp. TR-M5]